MLDMAMEAINDFLNARDEGALERAKEKARKVYGEYNGVSYKGKSKTMEPPEVSKRQELIASLPAWLRERASELLYDDAQYLTGMMDWNRTGEGSRFWNDCDEGKFDKAIAYLKEYKPEAYQKHYERFFKEDGRTYLPGHIKIPKHIRGIIRGDKAIVYTKGPKGWITHYWREVMERPYFDEEKAEVLEEGRVYFTPKKGSAITQDEVDSFVNYSMYLGDGKVVFWNNAIPIDVPVNIEDYDWYEVKADE